MLPAFGYKFYFWVTATQFAALKILPGIFTFFDLNKQPPNLILILTDLFSYFNVCCFSRYLHDPEQ